MGGGGSLFPGAPFFLFGGFRIPRIDTPRRNLSIVLGFSWTPAARSDPQIAKAPKLPSNWWVGVGVPLQEPRVELQAINPNQVRGNLTLVG